MGRTWKDSPKYRPHKKHKPKNVWGEEEEPGESGRERRARKKLAKKEQMWYSNRSTQGEDSEE